MKSHESQVEEFIKNCCKYRPEGGRFCLLGLEETDLDFIPELKKTWDITIYDKNFGQFVSETYPRYHFDLVYLHDVGPDRSIIDMAYQWGPHVKGGGALAGWGYRHRQTHARLLEVMGDCPSKWPDIWALPIVQA